MARAKEIKAGGIHAGPTLRGGKELRARIAALKKTWKPIGRKWAGTARDLSRDAVPVRTGRLRRSVRILGVSGKRALVGAHYTAFFVDAGAVPHDIRPKRARMLRFQVGERTVFARKVHHRGLRARPFRDRAAREALRRTDAQRLIIDLWNEAA